MTTSSLADRVPDSAKERRLDELRRTAAEAGRVEAPGVRAVGGPWPVEGALPGAAAETGYYGLPLLKQPTWIWTVPLYFFVGGVAGGAAIIAAAARWMRGETPLVRDARRLAVVAGAVSPVLLISDLGRPSRFLNMLRVFKRRSPMSVGAWTLVMFNAAADAAWLGAGAVADAQAALFGGIISTYTGVLIGVTTVPVWARNIRLLPFHFGMSGLASATSLLELLHDDPALHRIALAAAAGETAVGAALELDGHRIQHPVKRGASGWLTRIGGLLAGPAALVMRLTAGRSRRRRQMAALVSVAGSIVTRFAWIEAGKQSVEDPREPVGLPPALQPATGALSQSR